MYRQLDALLSAKTTEDSWYDDGFIIACEILAEFTSEDWRGLLNEVHAKPLYWQKKLVYCIGDNGNDYELEILLLLLTTTDNELFKMCVDSLRSFTPSQLKQIVLHNPSIIERMHTLLPEVSVPVKFILQDFLLKLHSQMILTINKHL
ncbi:hypothetical protein M1E11_10010 [Bacillus sp. JZ8]